MRGRTNRALLLSLAFHIILILVLSPFFINDFDAAKEGISAEILAADPEKQIRRRVLPPRIPLMPRVANAEAATDSAPTSTYAPRVRAPKAPVHADVVPDVVTYTDLSQADGPSPVSNTSFGEDSKAAGPVVIEGEWGTGVGGSGFGTFGGRPGIGIFGTDVMPGHGLIGQVYVPGGKIKRMPDFDLLTPVYTFVTPNLDVPTRSYTQGFPTPEIQSVVENFAIRFRAKLKIDTPGKYIFELFSDDGSQLYINGTLVVDNGGVHSTMGEQGSIKLGKGVYNVEIRYFQGPRHEVALQWFYQLPNADRQIVPPEVIYHRSNSHISDILQKPQQGLEQIERMK